MSRHTESQNLVLKAEVLELSCVMAAIAIKDQKPLLTIRVPSILMKVLDPFESKGVVSPAIVTNSNLPGSRKASLIPLGLVSLCSEDNERWDTPALCINSFD